MFQPQVLAERKRLGKMLEKYFSIRHAAQRFSVAAIASITLSAVSAFSILTPQADASPLAINIEIPNQLGYTNLIKQAEFLAGSEITRQFNANPGLNEVEVVVLGHYVGDIVPLLLVNVSRAQWQSSPVVNRWSSYYSATYALLARHDSDDETLANSRSNAGGQFVQSSEGGSVTTGDAANARVQVESAFGEGRLTPDEYAELVDALD